MGPITSDTDSEEHNALREHTIAVPALEDTYGQFVGASMENGRQQDEGGRIFFARGLAHLLKRRDMNPISTADGLQRASMERTHDLSMYASVYAVMKDKAWKLDEAAPALEMHLVVCRGGPESCRARLRHLHDR